MFLNRLDVSGYRASADGVLTCTFPGRFTVLVGGNGSGKTATNNEAIALTHYPQLPRLGLMGFSSLRADGEE